MTPSFGKELRPNSYQSPKTPEAPHPLFLSQPITIPLAWRKDTLHPDRPNTHDPLSFKDLPTNFADTVKSFDAAIMCGGSTRGSAFDSSLNDIKNFAREVFDDPRHPDRRVMEKYYPGWTKAHFRALIEEVTPRELRETQDGNLLSQLFQKKLRTAVNSTEEPEELPEVVSKIVEEILVAQRSPQTEGALLAKDLVTIDDSLAQIEDAEDTPKERSGDLLLCNQPIAHVKVKFSEEGGQYLTYTPDVSALNNSLHLLLGMVQKTKQPT